MVKEKINTAYVFRHLNARPNWIASDKRQIVGAAEGTMGSVGFGELFGEAHLMPEDYARAANIGRNLETPGYPFRLRMHPSPLVRAVETAMYIGYGVAQGQAEALGLVGNFSPEALDKKIALGVSSDRNYTFEKDRGMAEPEYKNSEGEPDRGVELINITNCAETKDPDFAKYRFIVQKGFEGDPRSVHPRIVAEGAIASLVSGRNYDMAISASHEPVVEILTAGLGGNLGKDANELYDRAGGNFALGGAIMLRTVYDAEKNCFVDANLWRTPEGVTPDRGTSDFTQEMPVDLDVLNRHLPSRFDDIPF